MRTKNTIRNLIIAWGGQLVVVLCNFISRKVFVDTLPVDYLGINGLFSNILAILSLADLGIGASIAFYLYKPLAEGDKDEVATIMAFFKKVYIVIGSMVLILGAALTPFLEWLMNGTTSIKNIHFIYCLYVFNSAVSYFNAYKITLIIADQKKYIVDSYTLAIKVIVLVGDIFILYFTASYIAFYLFQISGTIITNILLSRKANILYPYINNKSTNKISSEFIELIKNDTVAMLYHKIGDVLVNGTDNLLISKMVNVASVGLYSNYSLIILNVNAFLNPIFASVTASIGNFNITEDCEKKEELFDSIILINYWLYGFCSICLFVLFNPFIKLWLGEKFLINTINVFVIVLNSFLIGTRKGVLAFRDAFGLFKQDKYKALIEATINLVVSIVLANKIGMIGVFIGTTISTLVTCSWIEPYVLYKYGFGKSPMKYYFRMVIFYIQIGFLGICTYLIARVTSSGIAGFVGKLFVCILVPNIGMLIFYGRSKSFKILQEKLLSVIKQRGKNEFIN